MLLFFYASSSWTESQLRDYLLEQGVVTPKTTKEQLVVLAKQKYNAASTAVCSSLFTCTSLSSSSLALVLTSVFSLFPSQTETRTTRRPTPSRPLPRPPR